VWKVVLLDASLGGGSVSRYPHDPRHRTAVEPERAVCTSPRAGLRFLSMNNQELRCDGCGQAASPEHIAKRLRRLEWASRYRPVHVAALFLGAAAPAEDSEFLYHPEGQFAGEAGRFLNAVGISPAGKTPETILIEVQKAGFFLVYLLDCPLEAAVSPATLGILVANRLPQTMARIRRSIKPKKIVPIGPELRPLIGDLQQELGSAVELNGGNPFALDGNSPTKFPEFRNTAAGSESGG